MSTTAERGQGLQAQARRIYRDSVAAGRPVTPAELAAGLGRSTRWAQERIREATDQTAPPQQQDTSRGDTTTRAETSAPRNFVGDDRAETSAPRNFVAVTGTETVPVAVPGTGLSSLGAVTRTPRNFVGDDRAETSAPRNSADPARNFAGEETPVTRNFARGAVRWARLGFWLGLAVSIGANMLHAARPDTPGAVVSVAEVGAAAVWPVFLLIAIEILTRTRWPDTAWPRIARFLGAVAVAAVAGAESYWHMRALLLSWGEHPLLASAGPLSVDGLMLLAATSLLVSATTRKAEHR